VRGGQLRQRLTVAESDFEGHGGFPSEDGSGIQDIVPRFNPIVRPQILKRPALSPRETTLAPHKALYGSRPGISGVRGRNVPHRIHRVQKNAPSRGDDAEA
jgi:hypothetical protein